MLSNATKVNQNRLYGGDVLYILLRGHLDNVIFNLRGHLDNVRPDLRFLVSALDLHSLQNSEEKGSN